MDASGTRRRYLLPRPYVDAIQAAGGLALLLPPDAQLEREPDEVLDLLDGLILAGGADVDPAVYGADAHPETHGTRAERDTFEVALARRALERDLPFLGICRGMQVMNVALGGTLIQHLPETHGHHEHRRVPGSFDGAEHDVRLAAGLARRARRRRGAPRDALAPPPGRRPHRRGPAGQRAGRSSTSCPRPSSWPTAASRSASSGTPRPTPPAG